MLRSPLEFHNYKDYLHYRLKPLGSKHGLLTKLAQAAGCQRTYLSQVLHSKVQLTPDHACAMVDHWQLPAADGRYFLLMVDHDRAATPRLRARLQEQMVALRAEAENLGTRFQDKEIFSLEDQQIYYSAWQWAALHILVSIPRFQAVAEIAERLNLARAQVETMLEKLHSLGLVTTNGSKWKFAGGNLHLSKDSPLNAINHAHWRTHAALCSQRRDEQNLHYTAVFTMSRGDFEKLKARSIQFLEDCRATISDSPEEELVALNFDFFRP